MAAARELNRLELVLETMRLAIVSLVESDQKWVKENLPASLLETYSEWVESERLVREDIYTSNSVHQPNRKRNLPSCQ